MCIRDSRTTAQGIELEVMDAEEKRLAMLYFRWDEVAPLLRGMDARQQDGFGQEQQMCIRDSFERGIRQTDSSQQLGTLGKIAAHGGIPVSYTHLCGSPL